MLEHYDAGPALYYHWRDVSCWRGTPIFSLVCQRQDVKSVRPNPLSAKHDYCTFNSILTSNAGFTSDGSVTKWVIPMLDQHPR